MYKGKCTRPSYFESLKLCTMLRYLSVYKDIFRHGVLPRGYPTLNDAESFSRSKLKMERSKLKMERNPSKIERRKIFSTARSARSAQASKREYNWVIRVSYTKWHRKFYPGKTENGPDKTVRAIPPIKIERLAFTKIFSTARSAQASKSTIG